MESCKDVILRGLAETIRQAHLSSKLKILRWFGRFGRFSSWLPALALCKSIIPDDLLHDLRKSIIIGWLGLTGFRAGHSFDLARDLARSESFCGVSPENMTCASLCTCSPSRRSEPMREREDPRHSDPDVYLLYRASKEEQRKARISFSSSRRLGWRGEKPDYSHKMYSPRPVNLRGLSLE